MNSRERRKLEALEHQKNREKKNLCNQSIKNSQGQRVTDHHLLGLAEFGLLVSRQVLELSKK